MGISSAEITPHYVAGGTIPALGTGGIEYAGTKYQEVDWNGKVIWEVRHPNHRDLTRAEFQQITGLTDAQMNDPQPWRQWRRQLDSRQHRPDENDRASTTIPSTMISRRSTTRSSARTRSCSSTSAIFPTADVLKLGVNTTRTQRPTYPDAVTMDCISEVDIQTGQLVWDWCFQDHLIQNFDPAAQNYSVDIANQYLRRRHRGGLLPQARRQCEDQPGHRRSPCPTGPISTPWTTTRTVTRWCSTPASTASSIVVDHNTTIAEAKGKKGDFLYRFGSPYNYASDDQLGAGKGKAKFPSYLSRRNYTQIWGAHNIHWIPNGRPGAGHFLIFDNGVGRVR